MWKLTIHGLVALILCSAIAPAVANPGNRPNIVLIFADDLGWKDVGYQSDGLFLTPRIDQLAQEGMVFTDAYASAGNCAPSRACLLSGNYTPRHHLYAVGSTNRGPKIEMRLIPVPNRNGLGNEFVTVAEALKEAGYVTGHFGKWHLAGRDGSLPSEQGFDVTYDNCGEGELPEGTEINQAGKPDDPKGVFTLTRKACEFMKANRDRPFFCYLAHHAIHSPLQSSPETRKRVEAHLKSRGEPDAPSVKYLACTLDFDTSVGQVLDCMKSLGLDRNTLVVFTSDNGATNASSQEPLRGNKGGYYEGGIREPFIVRWPGKVQPGTTCSVPVINVDLFPTFLDAAGAPVPEGKILDGESLLPLMTQQGELKRDSIFWHFPGYLDRPVLRGRDPLFRTRPVSVIRKGDWKLLLYHEEWQLDGGHERVATNRAVELYNLKEDVGERQDRAQTDTDVRDELIHDLLSWYESVGALLPTRRNPNYAPAGESQ